MSCPNCDNPELIFCIECGQQTVCAAAGCAFCFVCRPTIKGDFMGVYAQANETCGACKKALSEGVNYNSIGNKLFCNVDCFGRYEPEDNNEDESEDGEVIGYVENEE